MIWQVIWFILWGVLWSVYFMLDGFDLGLGTLMPFPSKDDTERRIIYNAIGPFWDGNEVWLITAGGATFAAFPKTYAVMFSSLYSPLLLILFALILRGVAFEYRSKLEGEKWRKVWDFCLFVGSFLPALLFGVAFANIFKGIPFDRAGMYHGNILKLLNPYGLVGGIFFLLIFMMHGSLWLRLKTEGDLSDRAKGIAEKLWILVLLFAVIFLVYSKFATNLWDNYFSHPLLFLLPLIAVISLVLVKVYLSKDEKFKPWLFSALTIFFATYWGVAGLFPNLFPSSIDPSASLTIYNSSSTKLTLIIMTVVALIFVPIVIGYQFWAYKKFSHVVKKEDLEY